MPGCKRNIMKIQFALALDIAMLASACHRSGSQGSGNHKAASLLIVAGEAQSGPVGEELPNALVVRVLDSAGALVQAGQDDLEGIAERAAAADRGQDKEKACRANQ